MTNYKRKMAETILEAKLKRLMKSENIKRNYLFDNKLFVNKTKRGRLRLKKIFLK